MDPAGRSSEVASSLAPLLTTPHVAPLQPLSDTPFPPAICRAVPSQVGTLLEMVRDVVTALAADGRTVKVCVQQPLGEGVFQVRGGGRQGEAGRAKVGRRGRGSGGASRGAGGERFSGQGDGGSGATLSSAWTQYGRPRWLPTLPHPPQSPTHCSQGMPLSLNGVMRIMGQMDWGEAKGGRGAGAARCMPLRV